MKIDDVPYRSVWVDPEDGWSIRIFDQTRLPWSVDILRLQDVGTVAQAIRNMQVRGAPLIGAVAAYGLALGLRADASDAALESDAAALVATRPTAINLRWAIERMLARLRPLAAGERVDAAYTEAAAICDEDVAQNEAIGRHGLTLLRDIAEKRRGRINVLTHCNAGWIATVDWGTALAPIYMAHDAGMDVHVWVDETRPRNQGALLTAWELGRHGVPHTVIADNAGGHYMQHDQVDIVIVGTDRVTRHGDVCNKIGTYLKALAAHDNNVPFWVGLPSTTIDWNIGDGVREIEIEERNADEVAAMTAPLAQAGAASDQASGRMGTVPLIAPGSRAANPAFDVTPARLVSGLITERGLCDASEAGLLSLFPERRRAA